MKLGRRKLKSGQISYYLDDYHNGERIRESLGVLVPPGMDPVYSKNQKRLAEQLFQKRQEEILLTRKGLVSDADISLLDYAKKRASGRERQDHVVRVLPYLESFFGKAELRSVTYRDCDLFQTYLAKDARSAKTGRGLSPKTVRHYFSALSYILNEATRDHYIETSPASAVRRTKVPEKVVIALNAEELEVLLEKPMDYPDGEAVKSAFFLAVNTGLRFGDIKTLKWSDIEKLTEEDWRLKRAQNKSGNLITTPLNQVARSILSSRPENPSPLVFPEMQRTANSVRYVREWARDARIDKPVTFHVARHTFGTLMALTGANSIMIRNLMGHITMKMTEHYTQSVSLHSKNLVERLPGGTMSGNIGGTPKNE